MAKLNEARLELSWEECRCLRRYYECYVLADHGQEEMLTSKEERILEQLPTRMQQCLDANQIQCNLGVRVYIRSQTVKDTVLEYPSTINIKQRMKEQLRILCDHPAYQNQAEMLPETNMIIQAFFHAAIGELKVHSVEEIYNFLINSSKVDQELQRLLHCGTEDDFCCEVSIVEWMDVPLSTYYRGFIGENGELNGFCQYFNFLYFPEMVPSVMKIREQVTKLSKDFIANNEEIMNSLPCIIDFYYDLAQTESLVVARVIPFQREELEDIIEGELFDKGDIDMLLHGSNGDVAFRYNAQKVDIDTLSNYISPNFEVAMDEIVYEFHSNAPVELNIVGAPSWWCSLI